MEDGLFLKSITFLSAILKSWGKDMYMQYGFAPENMCEEVLSFLNVGGSYSKEELKKYKKLIWSDMENILNCLIKNGLIYSKDDLYFITNEGTYITKYMTQLSSKLTLESSTYPFRFYPNSDEIYGLN